MSGLRHRVPATAVLDRASEILMGEVRFLASKTKTTELRYAETGPGHIKAKKRRIQSESQRPSDPCIAPRE